MSLAGRDAQHTRAPHMGAGSVYLPDSNFRQAWDIMQVLLLFWVSIFVPLRVGFDMNVRTFLPLWWFELGIDVYFLIDIWLNFHTGYIDEQDKVLAGCQQSPRRMDDHCSPWHCVCEQLIRFCGRVLLSFQTCLPPPAARCKHSTHRVCYLPRLPRCL